MNSPSIKRHLKLAILLTFFILAVELVGGIYANSLALLGDAAHMFMDGVALTLTWFALIICERPSTDTKTFGYHRIETFAAFINGLLLLGMACGILYESFDRLFHPQEIKSLTVVGVAVIGLATNLVVIGFLRKSAHGTKDLNVKSAFYHILGDTLASLGVIFGGVLMHYTGWYFVDPIIAMGIACLILWGTRKILSESIHILLEGVPKDVSIAEVEKELTAIPAIQDIHELHIWSICSNIYTLSAHALVSDLEQTDDQSLLNEIQKILRDKFNITHSTIQFESFSCGESNILCEIKH